MKLVMIPEELYDKGIALFEQGKYEEAIKAYDKAIKINLEYADAWFNKGFAFTLLLFKVTK